MMYNISIDNLLNNYIVNIIDYVLCFATTHFLYDQVTITQRVYLFSLSYPFYYTYIYNFETKCYIMIVAALEIIYIYQSYGTLIKFNILKCILLLYSNHVKHVKGVQCYELFRGIALKIHTFSFSFSIQPR